MTVKSRKKAPAMQDIQLPKSEIQTIDLNLIEANSAQSRGMGVLSRLQEQGYGLFEKASLDAEKDPIWPSLLSKDKDKRKAAADLIKSHEPGLVRLADSCRVGQLQPIGVLKTGKALDVIFGMRRAVAMAFNHAEHGDTAQIEAKVFAGQISAIDLKILALAENDDRESESPIDKAMTYAWLKSEGGLQAEQIAGLTHQSAQSVNAYLRLLHRDIEDKRAAIHSGDMSMERALKLLQKRRDQGSSAQETRPSAGGDKRWRFYSTKALIRLYDAPKQPSSIKDEEWELLIHPAVRKLFALKLGLRYSEYKPEEPKPRKGKKAGAEPSSNGNEPTGPALKVTRERAQRLLIALGKMDARTYKDDQLKKKLEDISSIAEAGQEVEDESLQRLLDKLLVGDRSIKIVKKVDGK